MVYCRMNPGKLSTWVTEELEALSLRELSRRIGVAPPSLTSWRDGTVKTALRPDKIALLANYRRQSVEAVYKWLEIPLPETPETGYQELEERVELLEYKLETALLIIDASLVQMTGLSHKPSSAAVSLQEDLYEGGYNLQSSKDQHIFLSKCIEALEGNRLRAHLTLLQALGSIPIKSRDIPVIAQCMHHCLGSWDSISLRGLLDSGNKTPTP